MAHDAGGGILRVGVNRASLQAGRLEAVVAAHREVRTRRHRKPAAFDLADAPPVDRRRIAVLLVAGDDAALAADALAHVDVKAVLLARTGRAFRHAPFLRRTSDARTRASTSALGQREGDTVFLHSRQQWQRRHSDHSTQISQCSVRAWRAEARVHTRARRGARERNNAARAEHSLSQGTSAAPEDGASDAGGRTRAARRASFSKIHGRTRSEQGGVRRHECLRLAETYIHVRTECLSPID